MSGILVHSPADVLRYLMVDLGLGALLNSGTWPISVDQLPDKPDSSIVVRDTVGRLGGKDNPTGQLQRHPGIQIIVRAAKFPTVWTKAEGILQSLTESVNAKQVSIDDSAYLVQSITITSGPIGLGKESPRSNRNLLSINAVISLRQLS